METITEEIRSAYIITNLLCKICHTKLFDLNLEKKSRKDLIF